MSLLLMFKPTEGEGEPEPEVQPRRTLLGVGFVIAAFWGFILGA